MFAKNLEMLLATLCATADTSHNLPDEFSARFDALRRYGLLPRGRINREQRLTENQIASAILGLVTPKSSWAGHTALILGNLRSAGGRDGSFFETSTLQAAIALILTSEEARAAVVRLDVSAAESGVNSTGHAELAFFIASLRKTTIYVPQLAASQASGPLSHDLEYRRLHSPSSRYMVFNSNFFKRVASAIELSRAIPSPAGDGAEYDAEEEQERRHKNLGVRRNSKYLNVGVDNHVTWPNKEILVKFDKYELVLMPKTRDHVQSVHIDLVRNGLDPQTGMTVINRFLSVLSWCDDHFAIAQDGWSGNPIPGPVPKRDLAFVTTHYWVFDRRLPDTEEARRALALYREARNAQENFLISYAVLNFYKILEIRYDRARIKNWLRNRFEQQSTDPEVTNFKSMCGDTSPHEYLYIACRNAVAHAGKSAKSDPDDVVELRRLRKAADVLRLFVRHFISQELGVSESPYSGT
jgi:hypothetical protein